jgi:hypothetical protein
MIANISPNAGSCEHTLNTLRYADRVKGLSRNQRSSMGGGNAPPQPPPTFLSPSAPPAAAKNSEAQSLVPPLPPKLSAQYQKERADYQKDKGGGTDSQKDRGGGGEYQKDRGGGTNYQKERGGVSEYQAQRAGTESRQGGDFGGVRGGMQAERDGVLPPIPTGGVEEAPSQVGKRC